MAGSPSRARGQKRRHRQVAGQRALGVAGAGAGAGPEVTHRHRRVLSSPPPTRTGVRTQTVPRLRPPPRTFGFPSPQTQGGGRSPAGERGGAKRGRGPGTAGAYALRPGRADARAGVASAPRGGLERARLRGGDRGKWVTAPKAAAGLSRPRRRGDPAGSLMRVKRDMAARPTSPGSPVCTGKGRGQSGLDDHWIASQTTFPARRRGTGNASGPVRRRKSSLWLYKEGPGVCSFFCVCCALSSVCSRAHCSSDVVAPWEPGATTVYGELRPTVFYSRSLILSYPLCHRPCTWHLTLTVIGPREVRAGKPRLVYRPKASLAGVNDDFTFFPIISTMPTSLNTCQLVLIYRPPEARPRSFSTVGRW